MTGKKGRPVLPADEKRAGITLRLSKKEITRLDNYCRRKGWNRSGAIRAFIDLIADDEQKGVDSHGENAGSKEKE